MFKKTQKTKQKYKNSFGRGSLGRAEREGNERNGEGRDGRQFDLCY